MPAPLPLQNFMKEIGPLLNLQEVLQGEDELSWSLQWPDGLLVIAEYDEERESLFLTAHVGTLPPGDSGSFAAFLLRYNGLWHETGGIRMGLTDEATLVQIHDFNPSPMDTPSFGAAMEDFAEKARGWISLVSGSAHASDMPPEAMEKSALMPGAIRI